MSNKVPLKPAVRLLALACALTLAACADLSGVAPPQARMRDATSLELSPGAGVRIAPEWWRDFGDAQLDRLVAQALAGNPSLRIAQARLARAQAATQTAGAALKPQASGALDLTRQRYTENGAVPPPLAGSTRESAGAQLNASWEIDFFGKNGAALDAALGSARAAQADADAARIFLASNVVRTYLQWARADEQLGVARRTLSQREEALRLVQDRVNAGLDTRLELRQSEGSLPEARQQIEALAEQAVLAKNALAALAGQPAREVASLVPAPSAMKNLVVPAAIPADLLGQRADIAAARWRVEAAGHDIQNAKAQFYPNINLVAFVGLSSIGLGRLVDAGSLQYGAGPAIRLPIFDGGRLRANLRGRNADYDAAVESYNAALIDAVHDVADQLASGQSIVRQQGEQQQAQQAAESAYEIALLRYKAGLGNYLNVLTAETAVLAQRRLAVDLAARTLDAQVTLIRALGGGWQAAAIAPAQR